MSNTYTIPRISKKVTDGENRTLFMLTEIEGASCNIPENREQFHLYSNMQPYLYKNIISIKG